MPSRHQRRAIALAVLIGFLAAVSEIHADHDEAAKNDDTCCVTCCPSHNLAPSPMTATSLAALRPSWNVIAMIACLSTDLPDFVFQPPQGSRS